MVYLDVVGRPAYPLWKRMGVTPNGLTAMSGVAGVLSILRLKNRDYASAAFWTWISYMFDVFDGDFARTTGQETAFGDAFDHWKDVIVSVIYLALLGWMIAEKFGFLELLAWAVVIAFLVVSTSMNLNCQNRYYDKDEVGGTLNKMCSSFQCPFEKNEDILKYLRKARWFGSGCMNVIIIMMTLRMMQ